MMTQLLERAFAQASKLSEQQQDALAAWILAELASEKRWERSFTDSQDVLKKLADEALNDYRTGITQEMDPDEL